MSSNTANTTNTANTANTSDTAVVASLSPELLVLTPGIETLAPAELAHLVWGGAAKRLRALLAEKKLQYKVRQKADNAYAKEELQTITNDWKKDNETVLKALADSLRALGQEEQGTLSMDIGLTPHYKQATVSISTMDAKKSGGRQHNLMCLNVPCTGAYSDRLQAYLDQVAANNKAQNALHNEIMNLTQKLAQGKEQTEDFKHDVVIATLGKEHPELVQMLNQAGDDMVQRLLSGE